ncbi:hypothetical protein [Candidatus Accumulibacter sp. ACC007]|uniref:hypothetical protein n=1 Tax=Candidatus Accumulibacter sp. ACC007 TaxID=2823333 RepID=UPI0025BDB489|nr:hypothetical protein [Candidatus Accumulibacter sp. ACC007]
MNNVFRLEPPSTIDPLPPEGRRRVFDDEERVLYDGYWIKTYPVPADSLQGKKSLIEALARRLFNHTEHGLNIPGCRLGETRQSFVAESDPGRRRVKAGMLAGALFNRATDIFRRLVELQADGVEVGSDNALMRECGQCLLEAMQLGRFVLHRSGEEGIDELWGEPFRAFSIPVEDFYESRYVKIGQSMRDIDRIADAMVSAFCRIPTFEAVEAPIRDFAEAARIKTETLRTDPGIFDVWAHLVTAGERLASFTPQAAGEASEKRSGSALHSVSDGLQLLRNGRDLVFYIARACTPMPKSTSEYIERCAAYLSSGRAPFVPAPLPA